jgi:periplasmic divalent cation tolerance protein
VSRTEPRLFEVSTTLGDREQAVSLGRQLVQERLAACAQVGASILSLYLWRGRLEEADEVGLLLKVPASGLQGCLRRLSELHPYEVPQIVAWPASHVDERYARWAEGEDV